MSASQKAMILAVEFPKGGHGNAPVELEESSSFAKLVQQARFIVKWASDQVDGVIAGNRPRKPVRRREPVAAVLHRPTRPRPRGGDGRRAATGFRGEPADVDRPAARNCSALNFPLPGSSKLPGPACLPLSSPLLIRPIWNIEAGQRTAVNC